MNEAAINSLNRVIQHFEHNAFAIISASRGIYSKEENDQRTDELKSMVRAAGFGYVKMKGKYVEGFGTKGEKHPVDEDVLFIASRPMKVETPDMSKDEKEHVSNVNKQWNQDFKEKVSNLGSKFDQESIIFKPYGDPTAYLLGTIDYDENGKSVFPGNGVMVPAGVSDEPTGKLKAGTAGMFHSMLWKNKKTFTFESVEHAKSFFGSWSEFLNKKKILES